MNRTYALVWNTATGCWNVAPENHRRCGKSRTRKLARALVLCMSVSAPALALPNGPVPGGGNTNVDIHSDASGTRMSINQHSDKAIINWASFNIDRGQTVTFLQPNATSVALNRVGGTTASTILGDLHANGRIFIVNPNGIVFGSTAKVDVGALVASSANISDADFEAGNYRFNDASNADVRNSGSLEAHDGGSISLLGRTVHNDGSIQAQNGTVTLAAGSSFQVPLDGSALLSVQIDTSALDAFAENTGLLSASGGSVVMAARAQQLALQTVVNNAGVLEANTLNNSNGRILLDGGQTGTVLASGRVTASAVAVGGDGGSVEMRGQHVQARPGILVDTRASNGRTGNWQIIADNVAIEDISLSPDATAHTTTLSQNLGWTNLHLQARAGNLSVSGPISWNSDNTLALSASNALSSNGSLTANGLHAGLELTAGDTVTLGGPITLSGANSRFRIDAVNGYHVTADGSVKLTGSGSSFHYNNTGYKVIQTLADLSAIEGNLTGAYVLGNDIKYTGRFKSIGSEVGTFSGTFEGFGNTLTGFNLYSNGPYVGLFAASTGSIRNLTLDAFRIAAPAYNVAELSLGTLVGHNTGTITHVTANKVHVTGSAQRENVVGGLVGTNYGGVIDNASVNGTVTSASRTTAMGGLVGQNLNRGTVIGTITGSSSTTSVGGSLASLSYGGVGGLVGTSTGLIAGSSSSGDITVNTMGVNTGGVLGANLNGHVENAISSSQVKSYADGYAGGLVGLNLGGSVSLSEARGSVSVSGGSRTGGATGGLVGFNSLGSSLTDVKASGAVTDRHGRFVGGLVGANAGRILIAEASGAVTASSGLSNTHVGGLAGQNSGSIEYAIARGDVSGGANSNVGGLIGHNLGTLITSDYAGNVVGSTNSAAGGVTGLNEGEILYSTAAGTVNSNAKSRIGGIAGENRYNGTIRASSSSNTMSSRYEATLGGLVGINQGLVEYSSTSSNISVLANRQQIYGGLVGINQGILRGNNTIGHATLIPESGQNAGQITP